MNILLCGRPYAALSCALALLCTLSVAARADLATELTAGRAALRARKLADADAAFARAVAAAPNDPTANALRALTRVLVLHNHPKARALLDSLGVTKTGRDLFAWKAKAAKRLTNGRLTTESFESFGLAQLRPELVSAEAHLAKVADSAFTLTLTTAETALPEVTIDYGDVLFVRAFLQASICTLDLCDVYETNVKVSEIALWLSQNSLTVQQVLTKYPALLTLETPATSQPGRLASAAAAFQSAVDLYLQASAFIRARLDSTGRLIAIAPELAGEEARLREDFAKVRTSFAGPIAFDTRTQVSAGAYLAQPVGLRALLPAYAKNFPATGATVPDPSFAGVLPGLAAARADEFFAKLGIELDDLFDYQLDPKIPSVRITAPANNARVLATAGPLGHAVITGTAFDKGGIYRVLVRPTNDKTLRAQLLPAPARSPAGTVAWQATFEVEPGLNRVEVQAFDIDGNPSPKAQVRFDYVKYSHITVAVTGQGTVAPGTGDYQIGTEQVFTATPKAGSILRVWTLDGNIIGAEKKLTLPIDDVPQHTLIAEFIPNPYVAAAGTYNALYITEELDPDTLEVLARNYDGLTSLVLTKTGAFTCKVIFQGVTYTGRGVFNGLGGAVIALSAKSAPLRLLQLNLNYDGESPTLDAFLYDDTFQLVASAQLDARRLPIAPRYHVLLSVAEDPEIPHVDLPDSLRGRGYFTIIRDSLGDARVAGVLADGTKFTFGGRPLSRVDGGLLSETRMALFVPLDTLGSQLAGQLEFSSGSLTEPPEAIAGVLEWFWRAPARAPRFPGDFRVQLEAGGGTYTAPPRGERLEPFESNPDFTLSVVGDTQDFLSESCSLSVKHVVTIAPPNGQRARLTVKPSTGLFTGSFNNPAPLTGGRSFTGLVVPALGLGAGFSLRPDGSDLVELSP